MVTHSHCLGAYMMSDDDDRLAGLSNFAITSTLWLLLAVELTSNDNQ